MSKPKNLDECVDLARNRKPFNHTNVFGTFRNERIDEPYKKPPTYTVYSYGLHYPMYVYDYEACQWYGNADKSTPTTQRHKSRFKPHSIAQWVDTETLSRIAIHGIVETSAQRME